MTSKFTSDARYISGASSITVPGNSVSYTKIKLFCSYHCYVGVLFKEFTNDGQLKLEVIKPNVSDLAGSIA